MEGDGEDAFTALKRAFLCGQAAVWEVGCFGFGLRCRDSFRLWLSIGTNRGNSPMKMVSAICAGRPAAISSFSPSGP